MPRSKRGFTLVELMIAVAIMAILVSMAAATYAGIGERSAAQNTSHDFFSTLSRARARAQERNTDVWLIIIPRFEKATGSLTAGTGAWFLFEDADGNFARNLGSVYWSNFAPPTTMVPTDNDRLLDFVYLDDAKGKNVTFDKPSGLSFSAPFGGLTTFTNGCTFCDGNKGAVVFAGDGSARFYNKDGALATDTRVGGIGLRSVKQPTLGYLFGIAGATAFIGSYK